jgi:hypothetical protein
MSDDTDLQDLIRVFADHQANLRLQLDAVPVGAAHDAAAEAVTQVQADFETMVGEIRKEHERLDQIQAAAQAKIKANREKLKALQAQGIPAAKKREAAATPPAEIPVETVALHARLRDALLGLLEDQRAVRPQVPEDPGSIGDDLPAMDDDISTVPAVNVPRLALLPAEADEVARLTPLSPQARMRLQPKRTLQDYVAALLDEELYADVLHILAVGLPIREAVWWAGLCIQHGQHAVGGAAEKVAFRAAVAWILDPTAARRQAALAAGQAAGPECACGCLALAAGQIPRPLAMPEGAVQTNTPPAAPQYVNRAVALASARPDSPDAHPAFVEFGLGVAAGELTWKRLVAHSGENRSLDRTVPATPGTATGPGWSAGHNLGKQLLLGLGLVASPAGRKKVVDDDGFAWETSGEWNSLGM